MAPVLLFQTAEIGYGYISLRNRKQRKSIKKKMSASGGLSGSEALTDAGCGWHAVCDLAI
jgi:hypothetical protein